MDNINAHNSSTYLSNCRVFNSMLLYHSLIEDKSCLWILDKGTVVDCRYTGFLDHTDCIIVWSNLFNVNPKMISYQKYSTFVNPRLLAISLISVRIVPGFLRIQISMNKDPVYPHYVSNA